MLMDQPHSHGATARVTAHLGAMRPCVRGTLHLLVGRYPPQVMWQKPGALALADPSAWDAGSDAHTAKCFSSCRSARPQEASIPPLRCLRAPLPARQHREAPLRVRPQGPCAITW